MDQELKQLWLAALRSGKFRQARGQLTIPDSEGLSYCCLGVLLKIAPNSKRGSSLEGLFVNEYSTLNEEIGKHWVDVCIDWNDRQRLSFPEIADLIEENL